MSLTSYSGSSSSRKTSSSIYSESDYDDEYLQYKSTALTTSHTTSQSLTPRERSAFQHLGRFMSQPEFSTRYSDFQVTIDGRGGVSFSATSNKERRICPCCDREFSTVKEYNSHCDNFIHCRLHGMCMTDESVYAHAQKHGHARCFVQGCQSKFRREDGWDIQEVKEHMRKRHR